MSVKDEAIRLAWFIAIIVLMFIGVRIEKSFASPSPFKEMPATSTRTVTDSDKPIARCIQVTTVQRFLMKPDGTMLPISGRVTLLAGC